MWISTASGSERISINLSLTGTRSLPLAVLISLSVSNGFQFRFKKFRKKMIDLQQPAPREFDRSVVAPEQLLPAQPLISGLKLMPDVNVELAAEIRGVERAGLELQNHLADQPLPGRQRQRAPEWQLSALQRLNIILEFAQVLEMDAVEMRERRDAESDHISAMPERVGVNESAGLLRCRQSVGARDAVAARLELFVGVIEPAPLRRPVGDGRVESFLDHFARNDRVVGKLHLIDSHRIRLKLDGAADGVAPSLVRFAHHPGDKVNIDLREIDFARPVVCAIYLSRKMGAAVSRQNVVIEMLDAEAQSRDADLFQRFELRFAERARLALERDFFGVLPTHMPVESVHQRAKLLFADVGRRAAPEVGQPELPPLQCGHAAVDFILFDQRVEIDLDLRSVLVRVDFEVTEFAPLAAEGDVDVQA